MPLRSTSQRPELASLPSVDELLSADVVTGAVGRIGRDRSVELLRSLLNEVRDSIRAGSVPTERTSIANDVLARFAAAVESDTMRRVQAVVNATGVVIHTNLGRAPLSEKAVASIVDAAGYSNIEFDIDSGKRSRRGARAIELLKQLTGAEEALVVNNCAAAALMILSVFAAGREVIVSRGELVEIGGDFRIPDVLTRSGAILKEVGTTNRTHLRDYEAAISDQTAMILKVHPSNYRIKGFTAAPSTADLAYLARSRALIFYEDAGSGAIVDLAPAGVRGEPIIKDIVAAGAGLVSFSGDKLLGGPQSGIIVGRSDLVERLSRDPFYRALRVDKMITAGLEATLDAYAVGTAIDEVPVLKMLCESEAEVAERSSNFVGRLANGELQVELVKECSAVGGGASPDAEIETTVIAVSHHSMSEGQIARQLRASDPPVIARIEAGKVLLDLRTVEADQEGIILAALERIGSAEASRYARQNPA